MRTVAALLLLAAGFSQGSDNAVAPSPSEDTAQFVPPDFDCGTCVGCLAPNTRDESGGTICFGNHHTPRSTCEEFKHRGGVEGKCCGCSEEEKAAAYAKNRQEDGTVDVEAAYRDYHAAVSARRGTEL